jgi:hypothetical protein
VRPPASAYHHTKGYALISCPFSTLSFTRLQVTQLTGRTGFTRSLRPSSNFARRMSRGGVILPPEQIQSAWEENQPAVLEFIQRVL